RRSSDLEMPRGVVSKNRGSQQDGEQNAAESEDDRGAGGTAAEGRQRPEEKQHDRRTTAPSPRTLTRQALRSRSSSCSCTRSSARSNTCFDRSRRGSAPLQSIVVFPRAAW